jgi:hypothetical protein
MGRIRCSSRRTCHPCGHEKSAESAPLQLYMHAVYSPNVLMLSQIVCADGSGTKNDVGTHVMHESQSGDNVISAASAEAAVAALGDAWSLLQVQKEESGLAACEAWSCRLFVVPAVAICLHSRLTASFHQGKHFVACSSSADEGSRADSEGNDSALSHEARLTEQLSGVVVNEVAGLHDGDRAALWALRVMVAQ